MLAIVDSGPLYAAVDADDADHERCLAALHAPGLRLVIPSLVVAEATYLIASRMDARIEARFLRGLADLDVESPSPEDFVRMSELVEQYESFPLGGTDASVVALAERLGTPCVVTLDVRHFGAIKPRHYDAFQLLPE